MKVKVFSKFEAHPIVIEVENKFIGTMLLFENGRLIEHKTTPAFDSKREAITEVQHYQLVELVKAEIQNQQDMH